MTESQQNILKKKLWAVADKLRGKMNADEYRNYCLGLIFYKYLSERLEKFLGKELANDDACFHEIWESEDEEFHNELKSVSLERLGYFIAPNLLFSRVLEKFNESNNEAHGMILDDLQMAFNAIVDSTQGTDSQQDFANLFDDVDLTSAKLGKTANAKNETIGSVLAELAQIDFGLADAQIDILGDAYEYMLGQFAAGAGKKAGEFYTPQQVSKILARIVSHGRPPLKSVYDPTCGSGSLLLQVAKQGKAQYLYGQELNPTTFNLARMNMLLHGVRYDRFSIKQGDTLEEDLFDEHEHDPFDAVVANPPFSAKWSAASRFSTDDRFSKPGALAPKSAADYAFILHMIHHLADDGVMACVAPHGVLFRGASEGKIRRHLIETRNYIDAVIGLPSNLFFGAGIPTCILVVKRCRRSSDDILFIDASLEFEKVKTQNYLTEEHVEKIVSTYSSRKEIDKYSRCVPFSEIAENDYNLNITRYIDNTEPEEEIDIDQTADDIRQYEKKLKEVDRTIESFCRELDIKFPFGE